MSRFRRLVGLDGSPLTPALWLAFLLWLPGAQRPFHIDDPNFLRMAQHATVVDPLGLYDFQINWGGSPERAFDILSNPPGGPWLLALLGAIAQEQPWVFHLGFLPFLFAVVWGAGQLGHRFAPDRVGPLLLLLVSSPALVLSSHALMPDLPMLACLLVGLALSLRALELRRPGVLLAASLVLGCASLFRYNGLLGVALLVLYGLVSPGRLRWVGLAVLGALLPSLLWSALSLWRYGAIHMLASARFQGEIEGWAPVVHTALYQASSLGLAVAAPGLLAWGLLARSPGAGRSWRVGGLVGVGLALVIGGIEPLPVTSRLLLGLGLGGAGILAGLCLEPLRGLWGGQQTRASRAGLFLSLWLVGVLVFNERLRFGSVRYLLPALVPALLLLIRGLDARALDARRRWLFSWVPCVCVSLWLGIGDARYARVVQEEALRVAAQARPRWILGHWGWQYTLESQGAQALNQDACGTRSQAAPDCPIPGELLARATFPWPQSLPEGLLVRRVERRELDAPFGLRTLSLEGRACFYSDVLAPGPLPVLLPYAFSSEPWERIELLEVVEHPSPL